MAVTLAEKIWEKERAKVEKCPSAPNRCEKKLFPSRVGNQGDFDSHGQKYFPVRARIISMSALLGRIFF